MKFLLNIVFKLKKSDARLFGFLLVSLLFSAFSSAQTVKTSVNRDSIKIGEEVKFQIKVTSDSSAIEI